MHKLSIEREARGLRWAFILLVIKSALLVLALSTTFPPNQQYEAEKALLCNFVLTPGQSQTSAVPPQIFTALTGATIGRQKCVTPYGGQLIQLDRIANIMETDVDPSEDDDEEEHKGDETKNMPPQYKNPYARNHSLRFNFIGTSFIGIASHVAFQGISNEAPVLSNLFANIRTHANSGNELDFVPLGFNTRFSAKFLCDYFTDAFVDTDRNLRLKGSQLRWNTSVIRRFSNFVKEVLVESKPSSGTTGTVAMKRPLRVLIDSCTFIGGASFLFSSILPVGSRIIMRNSTVISTYDQYTQDNSFFISLAQVSSYGALIFFQVYMFGSAIRLDENNIHFIRPPGTSANSSLLRYMVELPQRIQAITSVLAFGGSPFVLHSTSVVVLKTKINAEAGGTDRAAFKHPNISLWENLINEYRIFPAVANKYLTANLPITFVSIIGTSDNIPFALITEGSFLVIADVEAVIDGRSVLVPASDDMWLNTTMPTAHESATTKAPTANKTITLDEFYALHPKVAPSNCYVLEVPTQISFSAFQYRTQTFELTQAASLDFYDIRIRSIGAQPRGGKLAREPFIENPNAARNLDPTATQSIGAGNSYLLSANLITDATAMKIVIEIAETLGTVYNNETYASVSDLFRRTNGYYTPDPESLSNPSDVSTHFIQVRSGVANKSLIDKFMQIEREIMGDDEPIHDSQSEESEELRPRDFSSIVRNSYNYHFTSPTRVASTPVSRMLYEMLFEGYIQKPLPFNIVFEHTYDMPGIKNIHRTCGLNGTIKISAELINLAREVKHVFDALGYNPVQAAIELEREEGETNPIRIDEVSGAGGSELPLFVSLAYVVITNPLSDPTHVLQQRQLVDAYENATEKLRSVVSRYYIQPASGAEPGETASIIGAAHSVSVDIMTTWFGQKLVINCSTVQIAGCSISMQGIFLTAKLMGPVRLELLDNAAVFIHEFNQINLNNTIGMAGLRSSSSYPLLHSSFTVAALEINGYANVIGPHAYIAISDFKLAVKYHKAFTITNVFAALFIVVSLGSKPTLDVAGDSTLVYVELVHFDTDTVTERRLQGTVFSTYISAVYCNSHLKIDGANSDPTTSAQSPILPNPPIVSVTDIYYDTRADTCVRSAVAFASGVQDSQIKNGGSLYINGIYLLTSRLARTPFYREAFQTNILPVNSGLLLSYRGNLFINNVVASSDSPSLVSCRIHHVYCSHSHSIVLVTRALELSTGSLFIARNVFISVDIKSRGNTRIALLDLATAITISGGSRLIFENVSLLTEMPTLTFFDVDQKVYLTAPDTMPRRSIALAGILLQGSSNLQMKGALTLMQISQIMIKAETVGNKTDEFIVAFYKTYSTAKLVISNGAELHIDSCNITVVPWDAPLEQKQLMKESATASSSLNAELNPWSWKSFSQLESNYNNPSQPPSLNLSFGGAGAPKHTTCSVFDSQGQLQVVPSTSISSPSAFSSIRISNVVANFFCGMSTNRTQEQSTPSIYTYGADPPIAVSAFIFSPLQPQQIGSYEGFTVTNLALSVFYSFAGEANGSMSNVWRPAIFPLFLGKIRALDDQAKYTTQDFIDFNSAVSRGVQYSEPQIDFVKRGALRALIRACGITLNGVEIRSRSDDYFYPLGYDGGKPENTETTSPAAITTPQPTNHKNYSLNMSVTPSLTQKGYSLSRTISLSKTNTSGSNDTEIPVANSGARKLTQLAGGSNLFVFANSSGSHANLEWIARGLDIELTSATFTSTKIANGGITLGMLDPAHGYVYNVRTFLENYVDFCPRTKTSEVSMTASIDVSSSTSLNPSRSKVKAGTPTKTRHATLGPNPTPTVSLTNFATSTITSSLSTSGSFATAEVSVSASASASGECGVESIRDGGTYWREHVTSQQLNPQSSWWKRVYESDIISGMRLNFASHVSVPPNISTLPRSRSAKDGDTIKVRAIMLKSAVTPKNRPINFHGIRGSSSPSFPYLDVSISENTSVVLEMRPLPKLEIYAEEWWDVYLPASILVGGSCAHKLLENRSFGEMWGAITPGEEVKLISKEGPIAIENQFAYFTTVIIEPNVPKPLADFANGFAAGANGFAIAVGALSSTVIASASADIQAVGIFAHMSACNSPQIDGFFGSPWVLSPVYIWNVFGDGEKGKMLGVIVGNFLLVSFFAIVQVATLFFVRLLCDPGPGSEMTIFGLSRFPSVLLSVMFGVHGGSVFAASRIVRLASLDSENIAYLVPASLVIVYYVVLPVSLYLSAWWCVPRTFQVYDLDHKSIRKAVKQPWLTKLLPIGAIYPVSTRQSAGIFISSFRRSSHIWVTSPLWVSTVSGIVGFAELDDAEGDYNACFTWGMIIGFVFLLMAAVLLWRMPKRHMMLTILDVVSLVGLALLYGFTVPWRQIVYPPKERFSEGEAGKINWPDLAVVILSFVVIGLVALRAIVALIICAVELRVQSIDPPTYIIWSHKSGGQMRAERLAAINRLETDRAVLDELFIQASAQDAVFPDAPFFREQNESAISKKNESASASAYSPLRQKNKRCERILVSASYRGIHDMQPAKQPSVDFFDSSDSQELAEMGEMKQERVQSPLSKGTREEEVGHRTIDASALGVIFDEDTFAVVDDNFVDDVLFSHPSEMLESDVLSVGSKRVTRP